MNTFIHDVCDGVSGSASGGASGGSSGGASGGSSGGSSGGASGCASGGASGCASGGASGDADSDDACICNDAICDCDGDCDGDCDCPGIVVSLEKVQEAIQVLPTATSTSSLHIRDGKLSVLDDVTKMAILHLIVMINPIRLTISGEKIILFLVRHFTKNGFKDLTRLSEFTIETDRLPCDFPVQPLFVEITEMLKMCFLLGDDALFRMTIFDTQGIYGEVIRSLSSSQNIGPLHETVRVFWQILNALTKVNMRYLGHNFTDDVGDDVVFDQSAVAYDTKLTTVDDFDYMESFFFRNIIKNMLTHE